MSDEGFLRRWSRLKAKGPEAAPPPAPVTLAEPRPPEAVPAADTHAPVTPQGEAAAPALPTLDDVARLRGDSDFSAFVTQGVDKDVQRLAMKKLFADPHFNLVDRLDVYMDDYNKPSPVSAAMLAALHHTKNLFAPLASDKEAEAAADAEKGAASEAAGAAMTEGEPPDAEAVAESTAIAEPDPPEPIQIHGAAAGGVLQQPQQGKA